MQLKTALSSADVEGIGPLRGLTVPIQQMRFAARHGLASGQAVHAPGLFAQLNVQLVVGRGKKAVQHQTCRLGIGQPKVFAMAQHQHGLFGRGQGLGGGLLGPQSKAVTPATLGLEGLGLARRQPQALAALGAQRRTRMGRPQWRRNVQPQTVGWLGGRGCAGARGSGWQLIFGSHG